MAENLKKFYDRRVVESLSADLKKAYAALDTARFVAECLDGLDRMELLARAWHIAEAMKRHLPSSFVRAAGILIRSLPPAVDGVELRGMEVFRYLPHVFYVSKYGIGFFEESMVTQYELTKRFTAEFSIRPFLMKYPQQSMDRLKAWAHDPNVHVRRLVSEGTRPRLPWAPRLRAFQDDPTPVLALLELLKDDPELYVRRSVANNLNDIGKDHPALVVDTLRHWLKDATPERRWICRHALRSLVKQGHAGALQLMGIGGAPKVGIERVRLQPKLVMIGRRLSFSFDLVSSAHRTQTLQVDYAVYFVKSGGKTAAKVFKLKRVVLPPNGRTTLSGSVSFAAMTTRKHYPGPHRLEARINGRPYLLGTARIRATSAD